DGVHVLKVTRRLPLGLARCKVGAFDRAIVAAANDRAAALGEGDGGDGEIVAGHDPTRRFGPEVVESYFFANPAAERPTGGCNGQRQQSPRCGHGPFEVPGGSVPEYPLAVAARVGRGEMRGVAPAVVGPIATAAGDGLTVRREGQGTNPIAMPFQ